MNSNKNIKIIIVFIIFGIIIFFVFNGCQRKMPDRIDNEIKEERINRIDKEERIKKSSRHYITKEDIKEKEVETSETVTIKQEKEDFYISDINREDYEIIEFNDDREKEIYGFYGIWINKENNKKYKEGNYGINEFGDLEASDDMIVLMRDFQYKHYLIKKNYIDSIGIEQCYKDYTQPLDLVYDMCKKNAVYKGRYVSDKFIEKYGDKNGLLYNFDFDEIEIDTESYDYELDDRLNIGNQSYLQLLLIKGKMKTRLIILSELDGGTNLLEDIDIRDIRVIVNENGENVKLRMDEHNWINCIERLAFSDDDDVGKSDRFVSEHPNFNGIIPNTLDVYPQTISQYELNFEKAECSYSDKKVVLDFYDKRKGRTDKYIIVYSIDNNMYINTYEIIEKEMISEDEYNPKADANIKYGVYSFDCKVRLIENNRDISKLPLTQNFIDNNFEKFDILHKIDMIDFDSPRQNNKIALTITDSNKNKHCFGLIFEIIDNLIDDVEITPLDIKEFPAGDAAFDLF